MRHFLRHLFGRCVRCEAEKRLRELRARALNGFATNAPEMAFMNTRMTEAELEELDRLERLPR